MYPSQHLLFLLGKLHGSQDIGSFLCSGVKQVNKSKLAAYIISLVTVIGNIMNTKTHAKRF